MPELEALRRLAPPVAPPAPEAVARMRRRALRGAPARRPARWALAPVACAGALALVVVLGQAGGDRAPAFAAELVRAAEGAPRLLLGDGWTVARVDEWSAGAGEMTFTAPGRSLELSWIPARKAGATVGAAKEPGARPALHARVPGGRAAVYRYPGSQDYTTAWRWGAAMVEARLIAGGPRDVAATLAELRQVDAETWLRALPAGAVTPQEHRDAVDAMLAGLPLPPGFDRGALHAGSATRDRYQLGAQVAGTVACGWIASWVAARAAGDESAAGRAEAALAGAADWPVLGEMAADGAYPEVLRTYADAVAAGGTVTAGKQVTVAESYRDALCP